MNQGTNFDFSGFGEANYTDSSASAQGFYSSDEAISASSEGSNIDTFGLSQDDYDAYLAANQESYELTLGVLDFYAKPENADLLF